MAKEKSENVAGLGKGLNWTANGYSFSQVPESLAGGEGSLELKPKIDNPNEYSLSHCDEKFDKKSDNINPYSASKIGRSLG